jgi:hypothetical protein
MDPAERPHNSPDLVGLQASDEMPAQIVQILQRFLLGQRFLQTTLAEVQLTTCGELSHSGRWLGLAHRQQLHTSGKTLLQVLPAILKRRHPRSPSFMVQMKV